MGIPHQISPAGLQALALLERPSVTEMHFVGPDQCSVRNNGSLHMTDLRFESEDDLAAWVNEHLLAASDSPLRIDGTTYRIEAAYTTATITARVHIIVPPVSPTTIITIAKRARAVLPIEALAENGTMSSDIEEILRVAIAGRLNFVISGGQGSGKTTLLNAMLALVGEDERIGVIEEVPELTLLQAHAIHLYNRAVRRGGRRFPVESFLGAIAEFAEDTEMRSEAGAQGHSLEHFLAFLGRNMRDRYAGGAKEDVTLGELVSESLRMRLDRIVIGEVRGPESVDLLGAMNTGYQGSACTIHASSAEEVPSRFQLLAASHPDHLQPRYVNGLLAQSLDLIIHLGPPEAGQHRVWEVRALANHDVSDSTISSEPMVVWRPGEGWQRVGRWPIGIQQKLRERGAVGLV